MNFHGILHVNKPYSSGHMKILVIILSLIMTLASSAQQAVEDSVVDQLLSSAEMASRTDLTSFNELIGQLESATQQLTAEQQCYLDYLKI